MIHLTNFIHLYGYAGMFLVVFLESSFVFPLPGDSLLFTAGIFAATGKFGLSFSVLLVVFFVSTFFGSLAGYEIGFYSVQLGRFKMFKKLFTHEHIHKVHAFFEKYGRVAMLISRFIPLVRTFTPIAAGMGRMNYGKFVRYNLAGSAIWSVVVTSLGFYLGRVFPGIVDYLFYVIIAVILFSFVPAVFHRYFKTKV